ncbi:AAA family ATPase [Leucobacter coleopterorum]|uniref:AAA family ATPase n=1 Tax=Leucobacter coleopterorum TaxID=2714933 RepID=A0ABX6JZD0_9MICO|nr:AAA family ATPase [Leucobacter coleopterorum]QIM19578.1 AAA family ATPase [Leucobacter coleopterorum]
MLQSFHSNIAFRGLSKSPFGENTTCVLGKRTVIYGRNGSGKTSLTEALRLSESGGETDGAVFKARVVEGGNASTFNIAPSSMPFRLFVYNRFYVKESLQLFLEGEGEAIPILRLGVKNVSAEKELRNLRNYLATLEKRHDDLDRTESSITHDRSRIETETKAEIISALAPADSGSYNSASFRVTQVRKLLNRESALPLDSKSLSAELVAAATPTLPVVNLPDAPQPVPKTLHTTINSELLGAIVESVQVSRLMKDPALSAWVEGGLNLHRAGDLCGFCQDGTVAPSILDSYRQHFNEALEMLRDRLKNAIDYLERQKAFLSSWFSEISTEADFLPDYRERARFEREKTKVSIAELNSALDKALSAIKQRLADPLKPLPELEQLDDAFPEVSTEGLSALVAENNAACDSQADRIKQAKYLVEAHFGAIEGKGYRAMGKRLELAARGKLVLSHRIGSIEANISILQQSLQGVGQMANHIDADLSQHFGHAHLRVAVSPDGKGYILTRSGQVADNLSEGERNAIAFTYFLRSLEEDGVDPANTVVVIDDPMTSLDKEALFAAFTLAEARTKRFAQTIVLTHDYEYFRLFLINLKNRWFSSQRRIREGDAAEKRMPTVSFLEVRAVAQTQQNSRRSEVRELPRSLIEHPSEYHLLFHHVSEAVTGDSQEYLPLVGNAARRLLEGFLSFRAPHMVTFQEKADTVANAASFDPAVKQRAVKFLHSQSHREEPRPSAALDFPSIEAELVATLSFIYKADGPHFIDMCVAVGVDSNLLLKDLAAFPAP